MSQLLIKLPIVLTEAVSNDVDNRQEEVFLRLLENVKQNEDIENYRLVFSFIETWHKENRRYPYMFSTGCGCEYCIKTKEYANLRLIIHRLKWRLEENYSLYPSEKYKEDTAYLNKLEIKLNILKEERKNMRHQLGYVSKRILKNM